MNLLYIFLSIFFSSVSPSFTNNEGLTIKENKGTVTNPHQGGTKKDKMGNNGDFIIAETTHP